MKILTRQQLARSAAVRWHGQYNKSGEWTGFMVRDPREIYERLLALGPNPNPSAVDNVIGNHSWTRLPRCWVCQQESSHFVLEISRRSTLVYDEPAYLCQHCAASIAPMLDRAAARHPDNTRTPARIWR